MSFGAGHWPFLLILLVIVLIIWGPGKLPELGSGMGKAIREFRKASSDVKDSIVQATSETPQSTPPAAPQPPVQPVQQQPAPQQPVAPSSGGEQPSA
jgi:sec-independent protein translocase protein TatA